MLHNILKIGLFVSLPYFLGIAARASAEIKFSLVFIFGCVFMGVLFNSAVFQRGVTTNPDIQTLMTCTLVFTPLGYLSGPGFIKYFGARLEKILGSDDFDPLYRKYAKQHKTAFTDDDREAFQSFYHTHQAQTKASGRTSYERYSQSRRGQSRAEKTAPPPQKDYRSDKDKMLDILEVSDWQASPKALKSAYRKLAWKYHPDVLAKNDLSDVRLKIAEARMQDINRAYDWLKDNGFA